jgi:hypothetical protein
VASLGHRRRILAAIAFARLHDQGTRTPRRVTVPRAARESGAELQAV